MHRPIRPLVAAVTGLMLVLLPAQPGAASTATLNSGHLGINITPAVTVDVTAPGPCPGSPIAISATTSNATTTPPQYDVNVTISFTNADFSYGGATYFYSGLTLTGSGVLNDTAGADTFSVGPFSTTNGNIYAESSPGSCTPGSAICAVLRANTTTTPLNGTGSFPAGATGMTPDLLGTAVVNASGGIQAAGCVAPFAALNGKVVTLTNVSATFT